MKTMQRVVAQRAAEPLRRVEGKPAGEDRVACGVLHSRAAGIRIAHENCAAPARIPVGRKPTVGPPDAGIDAPQAGTDATPCTFRILAAECRGFAYHFTHRLPFSGGRRERGIERVSDVEAAP
uniref:hypothetical protein n=1 Tax=Burkholderia anthina TaxID=179879 RepID=UPI00158B37B1|nr:hypothetical protein [Burkholderia anthina]